jgi:hypothetical protein
MIHYVCAYLLGNATGIYYLTLTGIALINFSRSFNVIPVFIALGIFIRFESFEGSPASHPTNAKVTTPNQVGVYSSQPEMHLNTNL